MFDFGPTVAEIDRVISVLQERILVSNRRRHDLAKLSGGARTMMQGDDNRLIAGTADDNKCIEELSEIRKKIDALINLPARVKSQLYDIYYMLGVKFDDFASRIPICYEGLLMEIPAANASDRTDRDEKREKAQRAYKKYELLPLPKYYRWVCAESKLY